jgi:hypothetical protein
MIQRPTLLTAKSLEEDRASLKLFRGGTLAPLTLLYAAPATVAGYYATHGIAQIAMPSATWQMIFSLVGAVAVGITASIRIAGTALPGREEARLARA